MIGLNAGKRKRRRTVTSPKSDTSHLVVELGRRKDRQLGKSERRRTRRASISYTKECTLQTFSQILMGGTQ